MNIRHYISLASGTDDSRGRITGWLTNGSWPGVRTRCIDPILEAHSWVKGVFLWNPFLVFNGVIRFDQYPYCRRTRMSWVANILTYKDSLRGVDHDVYIGAPLGHEDIAESVQPFVVTRPRRVYMDALALHPWSWLALRDYGHCFGRGIEACPERGDVYDTTDTPWMANVAVVRHLGIDNVNMLQHPGVLSWRDEAHDGPLAETIAWCHMREGRELLVPLNFSTPEEIELLREAATT